MPIIQYTHTTIEPIFLIYLWEAHGGGGMVNLNHSLPEFKCMHHYVLYKYQWIHFRHVLELGIRGTYLTQWNKHTWSFGTFSDNCHLPLHVFGQNPHWLSTWYPELSTFIEHQAPPRLLLRLQHVGPGHVFPSYLYGNWHFFPTLGLPFVDTLGLVAVIIQSVSSAKM